MTTPVVTVASGGLAVVDVAGGSPVTEALNGRGLAVTKVTNYGLAVSYVGVLALNSRVVFEGDSITAGSNGPTWVQFAMHRTRGRFYLPSGYNNAVGGQTAAQMATQTGTITALNPKLVAFLNGTNDLAGSSDTPAQIHANQRTQINAYKAAGARVIQICVLPRNDTTWMGLAQARRDDRVTLNNLIKAQTDVTVIDLESAFNPTTMCSDGLHPNYIGAILIGNAVGDAMNAMIAQDDILANYLSADNFLVGASENPALTGTTGTKTPANVTGEVATGWTVEENGGMTVVCSKTTLNGRTAQRIQVSGNNSTNGRLVNLRNTVTYPGQAGEFWECWWDFTLASGAQNLRAVNASCDTTLMPNASTSFVFPSDQALQGVIRPPNSTALAGADTSTNVSASLTFAAGVVAADFIVAAPYFRKVPAGQ